MRGLAALFLSCVAAVAVAAPPESSLRPVARPGSAVVPEAEAKPIPEARQQPGLARAIDNVISSVTGNQQRSATRTTTTTRKVQLSGLAVPWSLRPADRPKDLEKKATARQKTLAAGSVCGLPGVQGKRVGRVPGKINGCGVADAVRVTSVSGVKLSTGAVIDCGTAKALRTWIDRGLKPAVGGTGGGVASIKVAAHYACRTRNNKKGARISEHGKGRAIDISGYTLRDDRKITVLKGWNSGGQRQALRQMHKAACGPFGTVLGPNSDRYHRDHFHFDTARYRSGPYCR